MLREEGTEALSIVLQLPSKQKGQGPSTRYFLPPECTKYTKNATDTKCEKLLKNVILRFQCLLPPPGVLEHLPLALI